MINERQHDGTEVQYEVLNNAAAQTLGREASRAEMRKAYRASAEEHDSNDRAQPDGRVTRSLSAVLPMYQDP